MSSSPGIIVEIALSVLSSPNQIGAIILLPLSVIGIPVLLLRFLPRAINFVREVLSEKDANVSNYYFYTIALIMFMATVYSLLEIFIYFISQLKELGILFLPFVFWVPLLFHVGFEVFYSLSKKQKTI